MHRLGIPNKTTKTVYCQEKNAAWQTQHDLCEVERYQLRAAHQAERGRVLAGDWKGRRALLNALRSQLAAKQVGERADMIDRHNAQRQTLRQTWPPFPDYASWLRMEKGEREAQAWRKRHRTVPVDALIGQEDRPRLRDIRDYTVSKVGWAVVYRRKNGDRADFVDRGSRISLLNRDEASVLAAMQLASQKWGTMTIEGDDEYKRLCMRLAAQYGFRISNPELLADLVRMRTEYIKGQPSVSERANPLDAHTLSLEQTVAAKKSVTRLTDNVAEAESEADEIEAG